MTVYVIQQPQPNHNGWMPNLSSASEYGKIEFIFDGGEAVYSSPAPMLEKAKSRLRNFDSEEDFLLWPNTGDPAGLWTACFAITLLGAHKVKMLYWNRKFENGQRLKDGFYVPITYDLSNALGWN